MKQNSTKAADIEGIYAFPLAQIYQTSQGLGGPCSSQSVQESNSLDGEKFQSRDRHAAQVNLAELPESVP
jgi:hypothetical protein